MKKLVSLLLAATLAVGCLVGCGGQQAGYEIALITDKGNIDDKSFNQGAWEGVVAYAEANKITHQYYKPEEASDEGYLKAIDLAVSGGAKVVVCPGYLFEVAVYNAQTKYPNVKFILLDGAPHTAGDAPEYNTENNVACVMYAEEEAGFLAGYAAVKEGFTTLGFEGGMAVPAVVAFGYGYLQGIEAAAAEMGLADGAIKVFYHYTGDFAETDANKATAKAMIQSGAQVIFGCGGSVGKSVFAAAAEGNIKTIGVDVNQKADSDTVITSAMKGLGASVQAVLASIYDNSFAEKYAGKTVYFTAANNGVGLPDDFERFTTFTKADYEAIFAKLADGTIDPIRSYDSEVDPKAENYKEQVATEMQEKLNLKKVVVEVR